MSTPSGTNLRRSESLWDVERRECVSAVEANDPRPLHHRLEEEMGQKYGAVLILEDSRGAHGIL